MNTIHHIRFFSVLCGLILLFSACYKPEEVPLLVYEGQATHTIAQLQSYHVIGNDADLITDSVIISGIVTSTDEFGSCYKEIFIQDSTGGISIRTANSEYYHKYRIGQRVFIKCKGLYLGNYASNSRNYGWYQLGLWGNGEMQYLPTSYDKAHIFRSGLLETIPTPKIITNANEITNADFHTLVTLSNCTFIDADGTNTYYAPADGYSATSRNVQLMSGNKYVIVRTSQYADFALTPLPSGIVNITGLLTKFGDDYQLVIRSLDDVASEIAYSTNFNSDPFASGWTCHNEQGDNSWQFVSQYQSVKITGIDQVNTNSWFISPTFNFQHLNSLTLLLTQQNFNGIATAENLIVNYSINDGSTWKSIPVNNFPSALETISIPLPADATQTDKLKIAFQYKDNKASTWIISNVILKTNLSK